MEFKAFFNPEALRQYRRYLTAQKVPAATIERKLASLRRLTNFVLPKTANLPLKLERPVKTSQLSQWYSVYSRSPLSSYFHLAILVLFSAALAVFGYNQIFKEAFPGQAYPQAPNPKTPNRYLSFQARLTDSSDNPITTPTDIRFMIYNNETASGSAALWEELRYIDPDQDGIFSVTLGTETAINSTVFTENIDLWLGVTVETDPEAEPRQRIATVGYALNAETLQGFPPSASASADQIPVLTQEGDLVIAAANPMVYSSSGTFGIKGQALAVTTDTGTNGNITISPDGTGQLLLNGSTTDTNFIRATDANLTSGHLISGYVGNDTASGDLLNLSAGSVEAEKFAVDTSGNTDIAGTLTVTGTLTANGTLDANGAVTLGDGGDSVEISGSSLVLDIAGTDEVTLTSSALSPSTSDSNALGTTANMWSDLFLASGGVVNFNNGDVTITHSSDLLTVAGGGLTSAGTLTADGTLDANGIVTLGDGGEAITLNGSSITLTGFNSCTALETDGSGVLVCGTDDTGSTTQYWGSTLGSLYPLNSTLDFFIGGQATGSAKFAVLNMDSGTPTASLSAGVAGGAYLTADGTLGTTDKQLLTLSADNVNLTGDLAISGGNITTAVTADSNLTVTGTLTANGTLDANGAVTLGDGGDSVEISGSSLVLDIAGTDEVTLTSSALSPSTSDSNALGTTANMWSDLFLASGGVVNFNNGDVTITHSSDLLTVAGGGLTSAGTLTADGTLDANGIVTLGDGGEAITLNGSSITLTGFNSCTALETDGSGILTCGTDDGGSGSNYWRIAAGALSPINDTLDFLIGSNATASAKFAVLNVDSGTPTASIAGSTAGNALYLTGDGKIATSKNRSLLLNPDGGNVGIGTADPTAKLEVGGASSSIANSSGDLTITAAGDLILQADNDTGDYLTLSSDATDLTLATTDSSNLTIDPVGSLITNSTFDANGAVTLGDGGDSVEISGSSLVLDIAGTDEVTLTSSALSPSTSDSNALGTTANMWSDLFLASGGVVNFNNGDVTLTHSANTLTLDGGNLSVGSNNIVGTTGLIDYTNFDVDASGNVTLAGDLTLSGGNITTAVTADSTLTVTGTLTANGTLDANGAVTLGDGGDSVEISGSSLVLDIAGTDELTLTSSALSPSTSDSNALGTTANMWSDLFLASGGVVNFNNGDVTITHSSDLLTVAGGGLTSSGTLTADGTLDANGIVTLGDGGEAITLNGSSITLTGFNSCTALETDGSGILTCGTDDGGSGSNYWRIAAGALSPINDTLDFLIGSNATASAKFAVLNVDSGTPTASLSAGVAGGAYLTADGTLGTTDKQLLTLSADNVNLTGDLAISGGNITSATTFNSTGTFTGTLTANGTLDANGTVTLGDGGDSVEISGSSLVLDIAGTDELTLTSSALSPSTSDSNALGTTANMWSDLFLASGGVVNFNNGDVTLTHSSNTLTLGGGNLSVGANNLVGTTGLIDYTNFDVDASGNVTVADLIITGGNINPSANLTLGDGGDTLTLDSSDWDINATGDMTGIGAITMNGDLTNTSNILIDNQGDLRLYEADGGGTNYTGFQAPAALSDDVLYTLPGADAASSGYVLSSNGSGTLSWVAQSGGTNYWRIAAGALSPINDTLDFLIGSNATASAKFAVLNVDSGTPTASIAGSIAGNALYLTGDGTIATSKNRSLLLNPDGGNVGIGTADPTAKLEVGGASSNISNASGDFTLDIAGDIILDADGGDVILKDAGTEYVRLTNTSADLTLDPAGGDVYLGSNDNLHLSGGTYFAGVSTYYVDTDGNAKFLDIIAADTGNPGLTVGDGSTGYLKIGGSTIYDAAGSLTLNSDSSAVVISDDLTISGGNITSATTFDSTGTFTGTLTANGTLDANGAVTLGDGGDSVEISGSSLVLDIAGTDEVTLTSSALSPSTSDSNALGTTANMWSDLFLASGGVINFNNGDVTLTHSSNTLALAGGTGSITYDDATNDGITNVLTLTHTTSGTAAGGSSDSYTKALLHMDGADGSATFTDDTGKTWTAVNDAQLDTGQSKFGGSSGLFDGTGDYVETVDNDDFDVGSGDFTVDFWVRRGVAGTTYFVFGQADSSSTTTTTSIRCFFSVNTLRFDAYSGSTAYTVTSTTTMSSTSTWYHVALVRDTDTLRLFIDGVQEDTANVTGVTINNSAYKFALGRNGEYASTTMNGWIDEFRFSKGTARWTSAFTPPTSAYTYNTNTGIGTGLLFKSEDDAGNAEDAARIAGTLVTATDGSEDSSIVFETRSGGGALARAMRLWHTGDLTISGWLSQDSNPDVAENVLVTDPSIKAGDVVMLDPDFNNSGQDIYNRAAVKKADTPYSPAILGVISTDPGIILNAPESGIDNQKRSEDNERPLTLTGRVPVNIDPDSPAFEPGDYLTASDKPGLAIKADQAGQIIGKAMQSWPAAGQDNSQALVFIQPGYQDPAIVPAVVDQLEIIFDEAWKLVDNASGRIVETVVAAGQVIAARIEAGSIISPLVETDLLTAKTASISGEVIADKVITNELVAEKVKAGTIEGLRQRIEDVVANLDQEDPTVTEPAIDVNTLNAIYQLLAEQEAATAGAEFADLTFIEAEGGFFSEYLAVLGEATITDLHVTNSLALTNLTSPTGTIDLAGNLNVSGGLKVSGDVRILGEVSAPTASFSALLAQKLTADEAVVDKLTTNQLIIAADNSTSEVASPSASITTNATAGKAILPAGLTEYTIYSPHVDENSLVYVTPVGDPQNQVLYVKSKQACLEGSDPSISCKPWFTAAINQPLNYNLEFNWWIIRLE